MKADQPGNDPPASSQPPTAYPREAARALEWVLAAARLAVIVPVLVLVLATLAAFAYGTAVFVQTVTEMIAHPFPVPRNVGLLVGVVDLFLIGATLLVAAVGLYELFVSPDDGSAPSRSGTGSHLPDWLIMRDVNDLEVRVLGMVVLVSAVTFVEVVVDLLPATQVLDVGGGVAAVIVGVAIFQRWGHAPSAGNHQAGGEDRGGGE